MDWSDKYTEFTRTTAAYDELDWDIYLFSALAEEAGEAVGKYAKMVRKLGSDATFDILEGRIEDEEGIVKFQGVVDELGDVLYILTRLADHLGIPLYALAEMNQEKLEDRAARNVIVGEGDKR